MEIRENVIRCGDFNVPEYFRSSAIAVMMHQHDEKLINTHLINTQAVQLKITLRLFPLQTHLI